MGPRVGFILNVAYVPTSNPWAATSDHRKQADKNIHVHVVTNNVCKKGKVR